VKTGAFPTTLILMQKGSDLQLLLSFLNLGEEFEFSSCISEVVKQRTTNFPASFESNACLYMHFKAPPEGPEG
jgi:hypothetical protein